MPQDLVRAPSGSSTVATLVRRVARLWPGMARSPTKRAVPSSEGDPAEIPCPLQCDFAWRPEPWRQKAGTGDMLAMPDGTTQERDVRLFHNCPNARPKARQIRVDDPQAGPRFALEITTGDFSGSYLSLAVTPPRKAAQGLTHRHFFVLRLVANASRQNAVTARLNIRRGERLTEQTSFLPIGPEPQTLEAVFDLAGEPRDTAAPDAIWCDLICSDPAQDTLHIRDLTFARARRAWF